MRLTTEFGHNITLKSESALAWLTEQDANRLNDLWSAADLLRCRCVGDEIHLRGIIAISNRCIRNCSYCGINVNNRRLHRYSMSQNEIIETVKGFESRDYHTVVIQAGEDPGLRREWISGLIRRIKGVTDLVVTLSLGERSESELAEWKTAGAERYLLKFETSNPALYERLHPGRSDGLKRRLESLKTLQSLGYEVGSGVMVGLPGQRFEDLANDLELFQHLNLDMIGIGPYIAHPETEAGRVKHNGLDEPGQAPKDELTTYKMLALTRIACPLSNIPSTTALTTINRQNGRNLGLQRGANVVMPDMTPLEYRKYYDIYPAYHRSKDEEAATDVEMKKSIQQLGRTVSSGKGTSNGFLDRQNQGR